MTRFLLALAALAFLGAGVLLSLDRLRSSSPGSALDRRDVVASWRLDPDSNEFGPLTGVVWTQGLEGQVFHRLLCPELVGEKTPRSRHALEGLEPCPVCVPVGGGR